MFVITVGLGLGLIASFRSFYFASTPAAVEPAGPPPPALLAAVELAGRTGGSVRGRPEELAAVAQHLLITSGLAGSETRIAAHVDATDTIQIAASIEVPGSARFPLSLARGLHCPLRVGFRSGYSQAHAESLDLRSYQIGTLPEITDPAPEDREGLVRTLGWLVERHPELAHALARVSLLEVLGPEEVLLHLAPPTP